MYLCSLTVFDILFVFLEVYNVTVHVKRLAVACNIGRLISPMYYYYYYYYVTFAFETTVAYWKRIIFFYAFNQLKLMKYQCAGERHDIPYGQVRR